VKLLRLMNDIEVMWVFIFVLIALILALYCCGGGGTLKCNGWALEYHASADDMARGDYALPGQGKHSGGASVHSDGRRAPFSASKEAWGNPVGQFAESIRKKNYQFQRNNPRIAALYFDILDFVANLGADNVRVPREALRCSDRAAVCMRAPLSPVAPSHHRPRLCFPRVANSPVAIPARRS